MDEQLLDISGMSRLDLADEHIMRGHLSAHADRHVHSWLYTLRAARDDIGDLGYKFMNAKLSAVIGLRKNYAYVLPFYDLSEGILLHELCQSICAITGCDVILKKFHEPSIGKFTHFILPLELDESLEDGLTPETMLELGRLFFPDGELRPAARKLAKKVRTFARSSSSLRAVDDISKVPLERIASFLQNSGQDKYASYIQMVQCVRDRSDGRAYQATVFLDGNKVRGLFIAERFSCKELGFYCGITSKDEPGITEWMDHQFFGQAFLQGVRTVYLGGAETQGVATYIREKLLPHFPDYTLQTVKFDPESP